MRRDLTHINYVSCPACLTMFKPKTVPKHNDDNIKCICCHYLFLLSESIIYRNQTSKSKNTSSRLLGIFSNKSKSDSKNKASIPNFITDDKQQKVDKTFRRKAVFLSWVSTFFIVFVVFIINSLRIAIHNDTAEFFAKSSNFDLSKPYVYSDPEKYDNYYDAQYDYDISHSENLANNLDAVTKLSLVKDNEPNRQEVAVLQASSAPSMALELTDGDKVQQQVIARPLKAAPKFACMGDSCHDFVSDHIIGPELVKLDILGKTQFVMRSPLSRRDYYNYCYLDKKCSIGGQFAEQEFSQCLLNSKCSDNLVIWLDEPMEFISSYQINEYLKWLNTATAAQYTIITDQVWAVMASRLNANSNCLITMDNNFIVSNSYPEWVKINDTIAFREPINLISESSQCQSNIKLADADNHFGKVVVRLSKTS